MTAICFSVLEAEIPSKNKGPEDSVSGEVLLLVHIWPSSCCILMWRMSEGALWVSFMRALIPFMRAVLSSPDSFPKVPPPNTITSETRFQHMNFRGHKHSVYSTNALPRPFSSEELGAAAQIWTKGQTRQQRRVILPPEPSLGSAEAITGATSKLNFSPSPILIFLHFLP